MRKIDELLNMDSFQDMTDEEINAVIAWKIEYAAKMAAYEENQRNYKEIEAAKLAESKRKSEESQSRLDALISSMIGGANGEA